MPKFNLRHLWQLVPLSLRGYSAGFCRYRHLLFLSPIILVFLFTRHIGCLCPVQSLSNVWLFAAPWTAACQAALSITISWNLLKLMSTGWWCNATISFSVNPFSPVFNLGQHQGLFQWVSSSHQVTKVLEFQLQHPSFQWIFRTDFL